MTVAKEEGKQEGIAIGEERGKQEGEQKGRREMAKKLLLAGIDVHTIAGASGLSIEEIRNLER
jgi:predicted transposase/invertase (TIGR01784 family)